MDEGPSHNPPTPPPPPSPSEALSLVAILYTPSLNKCRPLQQHVTWVVVAAAAEARHPLCPLRHHRAIASLGAGRLPAPLQVIPHQHSSLSP